jgi:hypothetical protein
LGLATLNRFWLLTKGARFMKRSAIVLILLISLLVTFLTSCTASTSPENGTTAIPDSNLRFEKLWTIKIDPSSYEFFSAYRRLTWQNERNTLILTVTPVSMDIIGKPADTSLNAGTPSLAFKDLVTSWDATDASGKWISGTVPRGLEVEWKTGNNRFSMEFEPRLGSSWPDEGTRSEVADAAAGFDKNVHQGPSGYSQVNEYWHYEFYFRDIQMDITFYPKPYDAAALSDLANDAIKMDSRDITYYQADQGAADHGNRILIWQTDQGLFWLRGFAAADPNKASVEERLSLIDIDLIRSISMQMEVQIVQLPAIPELRYELPSGKPTLRRLGF